MRSNVFSKDLKEEQTSEGNFWDNHQKSITIAKSYCHFYLLNLILHLKLMTTPFFFELYSCCLAVYPCFFSDHLFLLWSLTLNVLEIFFLLIALFAWHAFLERYNWLSFLSFTDILVTSKSTHPVLRLLSCRFIFTRTCGTSLIWSYMEHLNWLFTHSFMWFQRPPFSLSTLSPPCLSSLSPTICKRLLTYSNISFPILPCSRRPSSGLYHVSQGHWIYRDNSLEWIVLSHSCKLYLANFYAVFKTVQNDSFQSSFWN